MEYTQLREQLLTAWIGINGILKDSKMTQSLTYNEAIVMNLVYRRYRADGVGRTAIRHLLKETNFLKSLMNRTVDSLCAQGFLVKERDENDRRSISVRPVPERLGEFEAVHANSLAIADRIIGIIGLADAVAFVRCCEKLSASNIRF